MTRRIALLALALALTAGACAYESSGTTTTTVVDPEEIPPATGPADLVLRDQMTDGAGVVIESVTLPSPGFVVLYSDDAGYPGEVIGATQILSAGVIARVPVSFYVPIEDSAVVHAQIHIDMDRNEAFTYEPPDAFVDVPASLANGEVAAAVATITLLPPVSPAVVTFAEQRTVGDSVTVLSAELPAPGFVAIREDAGGEAGAILGVSALLPAGATADVEVTLDLPLGISGILFASVYVDRDGDGVLSLEAGVDQIALGLDGLEATIGVPVTVVPLGPVLLVADDQETEGAEVVATATVPAPGFLVLRADDGGSPGEVLAVSDLLVLGSNRVTFTLDPPLAADARLWVALYIDFDGAGEFDAADPLGVLEGGGPARVSFQVTLPVPDDGGDT